MNKILKNIFCKENRLDVAVFLIFFILHLCDWIFGNRALLFAIFEAVLILFYIILRKLSFLSPNPPLWGVIFCFGMVFVFQIGISTIINWDFFLETPDNYSFEINSNIYAILIYPIIEEVIFRHILVGKFKLGILFPSFIFALFHIVADLTTAIGAFVIGLLFSKAYSDYKSTTLVIIMHIFYNLQIFHAVLSQFHILIRLSVIALVAVILAFIAVKFRIGKE
jgi:membrane protease YdiL (CAAX protease family)